ncbi:MAG: Efflux ABC transporter, permease/ATP-binding protein [uncultured Truepera sp.]|uniref:Efflux ABC transporter, permease/ATP-binding protein n=1 Tax=uncultured Truepera sp. TaxID=543023 RepID=A0A6J4UP52_9DEIN|nr:MAG: Efflux ABC transporter, permease/ATP-binding protein [uncultured Truepera sp.]
MNLPNLLLPRTALSAWGALAATLNALIRVAVAPILVQPLFDQVFIRGDFDALPGVLWLGGGALLVGSAALWAQDAVFGGVAARTAAAWRAGLYRTLLSVPENTRQTSGGLTGRVLSDLKEVEAYLQVGLGTLIAESLTLLLSVAYLFYVNRSATLLLVGLSAPLAGALVWAGRGIKRRSFQTQRLLEETSAHLQEGLAQREVVRAFGLEAFLLGRFGVANAGAARAQAARARWAAVQTPLAQTLGFVALALLLIVLTRSVQNGGMSLGEVGAFVTLLALLSTPAQLLPRGYAHLQSARAAAARLADLRDLERPAESFPLVPLPPRLPVLELTNLTFKRPTETVLDGVTLTMSGPALVTLTGPSGGGKTTLLKLLLGLLPPTSGRVLLAGTDLSLYPSAERQRRLAYVPQDNTLFRASLRDNLTLGEPFSDDDVWAALHDVGLAETLRERGLGAPLAEGGAGLSGGQRQRLSVARAILRNPDVLLLDEPSASLDADSEQVLVKVLERQAQRRLVVVVAHRPALIGAAERTLRLEHGRILETVPA